MIRDNGIKRIESLHAGKDTGMVISLAGQILALFVIMGAGYMLVKTGKLQAADSRCLSVLNVYLLMPCVIVNSFRISYTMEIRNHLFFVAGAAVAVNLFFMLVTAAAGAVFRLNPIEKASILYPNAGNLIIPLVASLLGQEWVVYASAYFCVHMIFLWTVCPSLLKGQSAIDWRGMLTNPNIIAVMLGLVVFFGQVPIPGFLGSALSGLSAMVGPACMLMIGMVLASVDLKRALAVPRLYLVFLLRMLALPFLTCLLLVGAVRIWPFENARTLLLIVLLSGSAPTATVVSQMAQLYGQDETYAGTITAVTTLGCIATMPLMAAVYQQLCALHFH